MISLGGKVKGCNIEVHDVQFVIANHIEETVGLLKSCWYGLDEKLHMDSYKVIDGADGFAVRLTKEKPDCSKKLFFVQFGGYKKDSTQELHDIGLLIGESEQQVKERASIEKKVADIENHVDSIICVEKVVLSTEGEKFFIELSESHEDYDLHPDWFGYRRLDQDSI
jgi:hypothetical protein